MIEGSHRARAYLKIVRVLRGQTPFEDRPQVVQFAVKPTHPLPVLRAAQAPHTLFDKVHVITPMTALHCCQFAAVCEALPRVFPDRLQHIETRLSTLRLFLAQQALIHERRHAIKHVNPKRS